MIRGGTMRHENSTICSILPPHILRKLIEAPEHREHVLRTLAATERLRGRRDVISQFAVMAVPAGEKRRTIYDAQGKIDLPYKLVRGEGDPSSSDPAVNEAY